MTIQARFRWFVVIWLAFAALQAWIVLHRWWLVAPFTGFFGVIGMHSLGLKLVTGEWPHWGATLRYLFTFEWHRKS